jgi:hypothetical protein
LKVQKTSGRSLLLIQVDIGQHLYPRRLVRTRRRRCVAWSGVGINLATNEPTPEALRKAIRTVLDKPNYRSRASLMADEFGGIDTRSEVLRIVSQVLHPSDGDDLPRGKVAAKKKKRTRARLNANHLASID